MKNVVRVNPKKPQKKFIQKAAALIKKGGLVAFPTETVYGLGANALNAAAVSRIFTIKGRPTDNPLIVHVAKISDAGILAANISVKAKVLMKIFWPGPLTLVLRKKKIVPYAVTAGLETVAVRMPQHPVALALIKAADSPIAAPSANIAGKPSPTNARHVIEDFGSKVDLIIDAGKTRIGLESSVIDTTTPKITVLRPGHVTIAMLEKVLGYKPRIVSIVNGKPRSPGMKYRHYAPKAPLYVTALVGNAMVQFLQKKIAAYHKKGLRVGVLSCIENQKKYGDADKVIVCGSIKKLHTVAKNLYACLRKFNHSNVDIILAENFGKKDLGQAIAQRLNRAAAKEHAVVAGQRFPQVF